MSEIKTLGELKKHIGEVLCFEYEDGGYGTVLYMKKIIQLDHFAQLEDNTLARDIPFYGSHLVIIKTSECFIDRYVKLPCCKYLDKQKRTLRYDTVRIPTKEEMLIYKNELRYTRIFGFTKLKNK